MLPVGNMIGNWKLLLAVATNVHLFVKHINYRSKWKNKVLRIGKGRNKHIYTYKDNKIQKEQKHSKLTTDTFTISQA